LAVSILLVVAVYREGWSFHKLKHKKHSRLR